MKEYISREYLLKEIKAFLEKDKWKKYRTLRERRERKRYTQIFEIGVKHFPAADVVEVVRCKDCRHMTIMEKIRFCNVWRLPNGAGDDGFCNYGERRGENAAD